MEIVKLIAAAVGGAIVSTLFWKYMIFAMNKGTIFIKDSESDGYPVMYFEAHEPIAWIRKKKFIVCDVLDSQKNQLL